MNDIVSIILFVVMALLMGVLVYFGINLISAGVKELLRRRRIKRLSATPLGRFVLAMENLGDILSGQLVTVLQHTNEQITMLFESYTGVDHGSYVKNDEGVDSAGNEYVDFLFTQFPGPDSQFVDVINQDGQGIRAGDWHQRNDGLVALRVYKKDL